MTEPTRVLIVDDSEDDAKLIQLALRRGSAALVTQRVDDRASMRAALAQGRWDLIICDWAMPNFNAPGACEVLRESELDIPLIIVSGAMGEESAVEAMRSGARDYLLKDRLTRLSLVVERELREARTREEHRRTERALRESEAHARRVEAQTRMKSEFLANMSHELRTPLNSIIGFAELLHDGKVTADMPEHQEFLGDLLKSAYHLLELINGVLDLSKLEAGKMDFRPEPTDVEQVVREVLGVVRPTASAKRLTVHQDVDPALGPVVIDPACLKQILYNYVSNALKFTPEGGRVTVRARAVGEGHFRLEVQDTGVGIAAADLPRLFVDFQQLDGGAGKKHGGTGLGLALTKRLVEAQGGSVAVESQVGVGSVFTATLPVLYRESLAPHSSAPPSRRA